ncbi:MAG: glycosyltransferase family 2 protein [Candidatus Babeliaceae bacterium]
MKSWIIQKITYSTTQFSKNTYDQQLLMQFYATLIPAQSRILQIGSKNRFLFAVLHPCYGVGIESNDELLKQAQADSADYRWYKNLTEITPEKFDYIILSRSIMEATDLQQLFEQLLPFCTMRTRIVIDWYAKQWQPFFWMTRKKDRQHALKNWFFKRDIIHFLHLAGFEIITQGRTTLFPFYIPGISWFFNSVVASLPVISWFCLNRWLIMRPYPLSTTSDTTVSVIVPCRNEQGNVENVARRIPHMGQHTEIIFIEGNSRDNTVQEIERVIQKYPEKDIKLLLQTGKGKGDAVRLGFQRAQGEILMILDADLTVMPEELPKFYQALMQGKAECANGSRLVYCMEKDAMLFLNFWVNHAFGILISWILGQPIKDTLCGTKVFYKKNYVLFMQNRSFFGENDPFGDFDLLFGAAHLNLKIIDIPVRYKSRAYGSSQIGGYFFNGLLLLRMCWIGYKKFKLRW